jgi:hypothetical protein
MHTPKNIQDTMDYKLSFQFSNQGLFNPYQYTHSSWIYMKMKIKKLEKEKEIPEKIHKLLNFGKKGVNFER